MHLTRCGVDVVEGQNIATLPIASPIKESPKAPPQAPLRPPSPPLSLPAPPSSNSAMRNSANDITEALIAMGTDPETAVILGQKCLTLDEAVEYLPRSDSQP